MPQSFKKGQRVVYMGPVLYLRGLAGRVRSVSRDGWVYVDFARALNIACAQVNLTVSTDHRA